MYSHLPPWDLLLKKMVWAQIGPVANKKILDFGSGEGITANYFAEQNEVVAVEPSSNFLNNRMNCFPYLQIHGSIEALQAMEESSFDIILCHNVLEYVSEHTPILKEFERLLKPNGKLSVVKHNRNGRVMQMVVLLNDFSHATEVLNGSNGHTALYGDIQYYDENELTQQTNLTLESKKGIRTFWHLQQNQECHHDTQWQEKMLAMEDSVSQIKDFMNIAMFHHLTLTKSNTPL